jgi:hypothetical protein
MDIRPLVASFTDRIASIVEAQAVERARLAVESALGPGKPGRRGKTLLLSNGRTRRKGPIQLCPVPGCKNPAAPVFGMVCAKHKDVPKKKIAKYREARRAKKLTAA